LAQRERLFRRTDNWSIDPKRRGFGSEVLEAEVTRPARPASPSSPFWRREHGIVASQFEFLRYLRGHSASRVADLAANFAAGLGAISEGVDRLEARGLVRRHANPADGRSSLVSLTTAGERLAAEAEHTFRVRLAELVSPNDPPGGSTAEALATLRAALERDRTGLPVG
jgi:DNA-binding MarR family transcriptional regulator